MKYYLLSLNNNVCAYKNDIPTGDSYSKNYFKYDQSRDFRKLIIVEFENPNFLFIKPKNTVQHWNKETDVSVLAFEQNEKIYDAITRKEIIFADEKKAHGESSTYYDCLTYSSKSSLSEKKLAEIAECFLDYEQNVYIYAECIDKVEEYNHYCYLQTIKMNKEKEKELVRTRSIINEFQKKYGK